MLGKPPKVIKKISQRFASIIFSQSSPDIFSRIPSEAPPRIRATFFSGNCSKLLPEIFPQCIPQIPLETLPGISPKVPSRNFPETHPRISSKMLSWVFFPGIISQISPEILTRISRRIPQSIPFETFAKISFGVF